MDGVSKKERKEVRWRGSFLFLFLWFLFFFFTYSISFLFTYIHFLLLLSSISVNVTQFVYAFTSRRTLGFFLFGIIIKPL